MVEAVKECMFMQVTCRATYDIGSAAISTPNIHLHLNHSLFNDRVLSKNIL